MTNWLGFKHKSVLFLPSLASQAVIYLFIRGYVEYRLTHLPST